MGKTCDLPLLHRHIFLYAMAFDPALLSRLLQQALCIVALI